MCKPGLDVDEPGIAAFEHAAFANVGRLLASREGGLLVAASLVDRREKLERADHHGDVGPVQLAFKLEDLVRFATQEPSFRVVLVARLQTELPNLGGLLLGPLHGRLLGRRDVEEKRRRDDDEQQRRQEAAPWITRPGPRSRDVFEFTQEENVAARG